MTGFDLAAIKVVPINTSIPVFVLALLGCTVAFLLLMTALHQLSPSAKKWMTIVCTFLAGLYFALEFFWPRHINPATKQMENFVTPTLEGVTTFVSVAVAWTMGLGLISLLLVHVKRLLRFRAGWHDSLAFFLALIAMLLIGFWAKGGTNPDAPKVVTSAYTSLFNGLLINLDAAMFSLLAFYIASAAYRAFRVRTVEAGLLMLAAFIVMLGLVNFGVEMTAWIPADSPWAFFRLERLGAFVLGWLNMPAARAVAIGVLVGSLAMAMRLWLSLERGAFFSQEK